MGTQTEHFNFEFLKGKGTNTETNVSSLISLILFVQEHIDFETDIQI